MNTKPEEVLNLDSKDFMVALEAYLDACNEGLKARGMQTRYKLGRRWIRIERVTGIEDQNSPHSMIDMVTGDIRPAYRSENISGKYVAKPGKYSVGNILTGNWKKLPSYNFL